MPKKYISKKIKIANLLHNKFHFLENKVSEEFKKSIKVLINYCKKNDDQNDKENDDQNDKKYFTFFSDKRYNQHSFFSLLRLELDKTLNNAENDIDSESKSMVSSISHTIKDDNFWEELKWRKTHNELDSFVEYIQTANMWISSGRQFFAGSREDEINNEILEIGEILIAIHTITSEINKYETENIKICKYCFRITLSSWNLCCKNHASDTHNEKRTNTKYNRGKRGFNRLGDEDKKNLSIYKALREGLGDNIDFQSSFGRSSYPETGILLIDAKLHIIIDQVQKNDWSQSTINLIENHLVKYSNLFAQLQPILLESASYDAFREKCLSKSILDHAEDPSEHPYWLFQSIKIANSLMRPRKNKSKSITSQ